MSNNSGYEFEGILNKMNSEGGASDSGSKYEFEDVLASANEEPDYSIQHNEYIEKRAVETLKQKGHDFWDVFSAKSGQAFSDAIEQAKAQDKEEREFISQSIYKPPAPGQIPRRYTSLDVISGEAVFVPGMDVPLIVKKGSEDFILERFKNNEVAAGPQKNFEITNIYGEKESSSMPSEAQYSQWRGEMESNELSRQLFALNNFNEYRAFPQMRKDMVDAIVTNFLGDESIGSLGQIPSEILDRSEKLSTLVQDVSKAIPVKSGKSIREQATGIVESGFGAEYAESFGEITGLGSPIADESDRLISLAERYSGGKLRPDVEDMLRGEFERQYKLKEGGMPLMLETYGESNPWVRNIGDFVNIFMGPMALMQGVGLAAGQDLQNVMQNLPATFPGEGQSVEERAAASLMDANLVDRGFKVIQQKYNFANPAEFKNDYGASLELNSIFYSAAKISLRTGKPMGEVLEQIYSVKGSGKIVNEETGEVEVVIPRHRQLFDYFASTYSPTEQEIIKELHEKKGSAVVSNFSLFGQMKGSTVKIQTSDEVFSGDVVRADDKSVTIRNNNNDEFVVDFQDIDFAISDSPVAGSGNVIGEGNPYWRNLPEQFDGFKKAIEIADVFNERMSTKGPGRLWRKEIVKNLTENPERFYTFEETLKGEGSYQKYVDKDGNVSKDKYIRVDIPGHEEVWDDLQRAINNESPIEEIDRLSKMMAVATGSKKTKDGKLLKDWMRQVLEGDLKHSSLQELNPNQQTFLFNFLAQAGEKGPFAREKEFLGEDPERAPGIGKDPEGLDRILPGEMQFRKDVPIGSSAPSVIRGLSKAINVLNTKQGFQYSAWEQPEVLKTYGEEGSEWYIDLFAPPVMVAESIARNATEVVGNALDWGYPDVLGAAATSGRAAKNDEVLYRLALSGAFGESFVEHPQVISSMAALAKAEAINELAGSSVLLTYAQAIPEGMWHELKLTAAGMSAFYKDEDELTELEKEGKEKWIKHPVNAAFDFALFLNVTARGAKAGITTAEYLKNRNLSARDLASDAVPTPSKISPLAVSILDNIDKVTADPSRALLKSGKNMIVDVSGLVDRVPPTVKTSSRYRKSDETRVMERPRFEETSLKREVIKDSASKGKSLTTPDGVEIPPTLASNVASSKDIAGPQIPSPERSAFGDTWRRDRGEFDKKGIVLESNRISLDDIETGVSPTDARVARSAASKAKRDGDIELAELHEEQSRILDRIGEERAAARAELDLMAPETSDLSSASIRAKSNILSNVDKDAAISAGEVFAGVDDYTKTNIFSETQSQKTRAFKRDAASRLDEVEKSPELQTEAQSRLDKIEQDIAMEMGFGDDILPSGSRRGTLSPIEMEQVLIRYRNSLDPNTRAFELSMRNVGDPAVYARLGIPAKSVLAYSSQGMDRAAGRFVRIQGDKHTTPKRQSSHESLHRIESDIAASKNMSLPEYRKEMSVRKKAEAMVRSGIDDPYIYELIGVKPDDAVALAKEASLSSDKPLVIVKDNPSKSLSASREVEIKDLKPYGMVEPKSWMEVLARRFFSDVGYETYKGIRSPTVAGMPFSEGGRKAWAVAEFMSRPFSIVNVPAWAQDISGNLLANHGAGKYQLNEAFHKFLIYVNKPSVKMGRDALTEFKKAFGESSYQIGRLNYMLRKLQGKPDADIRISSVEFERLMHDIGKASEIKNYAGNFDSDGGITLKIAQVNRISDAMKRMADDYIIESIDGVNVRLGDIATKQAKFQGKWVNLDELDTAVNDKVYTKKYAMSGVSDFRYIAKEGITDLTDNQRTALIIANEFARPVDKVMFDMAIQMTTADDALRLGVKDGKVMGTPLLNLKKDAISKAANWMSDYYDARASYTLVLDLLGKMKKNANSINVDAAIQELDGYLGRLFPGGMDKNGKFTGKKLSELVESYKNEGKWEHYLESGEWSGVVERYYRSKIWGDIPYNSKIMLGLFDYREAVSTTLLNMGENLGRQRLLVWARENGLLRTREEIYNASITPKGQRSRYVELGAREGVPFAPTDIAAGKAMQRLKDMDKTGGRVWGQTKGMYVHEYFNEMIVRHEVLHEASRGVLQKVNRYAKLGKILNPDTVFRNVLSNSIIFGQIAENPFRGTHLSEAHKMIMDARRKGIISPELAAARREGYGASNTIRAERLSDADYVNLQYEFAKDIDFDAFRDSANPSKLGETVGSMLEGLAPDKLLQGQKDPVARFIKQRRLHQMKDPMFLRERVTEGLQREAPYKGFREAGSWAKKKFQEGADAYGYVDDLYKFAYFLELTRKHKKTARDAVHIADDVFMDYSDVSPLVDHLSSEVLLPWGSPFMRFSVKALQKSANLAANYPARAAIWNSWMQGHLRATAEVLNLDMEDIMSMMITTDQIPMPYLTMEEKSRAKEMGETLPLKAGPLGMNRGAFSPFGGITRDLAYLSRQPSSGGQLSALVSAMLPDGGVISQAIMNAWKGAKKPHSRWDVSDPYGDALNKNDGFLSRLAGDFLGELSPQVVSTWYRYLVDDDVSDVKHLWKVLGFSSSVQDPLARDLEAAKTIDDRINVLRDQVNKILKGFKQSEESPGWAHAPSPEEVAYAHFMETEILNPWYGVDGEGPVGKRGKRKKGWKGRPPIKDDFDELRRIRYAKSINFSLPYLLIAMRKGAWIPSEETKSMVFDSAQELRALELGLPKMPSSTFAE